MAWTTRDRKIQRRAERRGTGRVRRITDEDRAAAAAWAAAHRHPGPEAEPARPAKRQPRRHLRKRATFGVQSRDGQPGYLIGERWYKGHASDQIAARRDDAVLIRRTYGEADGDGLWRNIVLYDLRAGAAWRRLDLSWHIHRQDWRRCQGLTEARVSAPELLAWAEGEVKTWPKTLSERITEAEVVVGAMTQGGEVSAALVRAAALGLPAPGRPRKLASESYADDGEAD